MSVDLKQLEKHDRILTNTFKAGFDELV